MVCLAVSSMSIACQRAHNTYGAKSHCVVLLPAVLTLSALVVAMAKKVASAEGASAEGACLCGIRYRSPVNGCFFQSLVARCKANKRVQVQWPRFGQLQKL